MDYAFFIDTYCIHLCMDILGSIFNGAISKRVNEAIAKKQSSTFANALSSINITLNNALPTINPDGADYYQSFKTIGAFYEVTDAICKKVCASPIVAYKVKDKKKLLQAKSLERHDPVQSHLLKLQAIEEVDIPGLGDLLGKGQANPYQTGSQFLGTTVLSYLTSGNTYVHAVKSGKKAKELYCFPNMVIDVDVDDLLDPIRGYTLQNSTLKKFEKDEIQHIKTGNNAPIDRRMEYLYGVAPLRAYLESLRTISEGKRQSSKQVKNGGVFGVLSPKNKIDEFGIDQRTQMKEKLWDARHSDDELSRIFPSSISLEWQNIGLPSGELQLLEVVGASEQDVYRAYHVPLQYHNQKASTSNNQNTATRQFIFDAVAPICAVMGEAFTNFLSAGYDFDYIEFDYTQLPEMAVNMKEVAAYVITLVEAGVLTPNEGRAAVRYGEKTEAYMNEHYVNSGIVPLSRVYEGLTS